MLRTIRQLGGLLTCTNRDIDWHEFNTNLNRFIYII